MPHDSKRPAPRPARAGGNALLAGIVIGLLLGLMISVAVAFYWYRAPNPFAARSNGPEVAQPTVRPAQPSAATAPATAPPVSSAPAAGATAPPAAPDRPRFDFYEVLPGDKPAVPRPAEKAAKAPEAPPAAPKPAASAPAASYFLQAGAFSSADEADNLKARLALMGFEANVRPAEVPGKGKLFRVRVGPYAGTELMNQAKARLAENGVQASVVKAGDAPPN